MKEIKLTQADVELMIFIILNPNHNYDESIQEEINRLYMTLMGMRLQAKYLELKTEREE